MQIGFILNDKTVGSLIKCSRLQATDQLSWCSALATFDAALF